MAKRGKLSYLWNVRQETLVNGEREQLEELIVEGDEGVTIKYFHKNSSGMEKIHIKKQGDNYVMKTQTGDQKDEKTLSKEEFLKELSKNKKLKFASQFAKTQTGSSLLFGGAKKGSKKGSKKSSKKGSKKSSKKSSKRSKRGSKAKRC